MSAPEEKSLRDVINAWSPVVRGKKGLLGLALKAVALPVEAAQNAAHMLQSFPFHFGHENAAGQVITDCDASIPKTYARMEKKLQSSFNEAAGPKASPIDRENFLRLAGKVSADSEVLAKHCTILHTEFDNVTEPYKFIVLKETVEGGSTKLTSLEEGAGLIRRRMNNETAPESVKNPVSIRRNPLSLPKPDENGARGLGF